MDISRGLMTTQGLKTAANLISKVTNVVSVWRVGVSEATAKGLIDMPVPTCLLKTSTQTPGQPVLARLGSGIDALSAGSAVAFTLPYDMVNTPDSMLGWSTPQNRSGLGTSPYSRVNQVRLGSHKAASGTHKIASHNNEGTARRPGLPAKPRGRRTTTHSLDMKAFPVVAMVRCGAKPLVPDVDSKPVDAQGFNSPEPQKISTAAELRVMGAAARPFSWKLWK